MLSVGLFGSHQIGHVGAVVPEPRRTTTEAQVAVPNGVGGETEIMP